MPPVNSGMVRELPAAVKQLLSTEISREILRRHHGLERAAGASPGRPGAEKAAGSPVRNPRPAVRPVPKAIKPSDVPDAKPVERRDMFGRVLPSNRGVKRSASAMRSADACAQPFRYKYQEGVTDAVRRTVRVRDLL